MEFLETNRKVERNKNITPYFFKKYVYKLILKYLFKLVMAYVLLYVFKIFEITLKQNTNKS